MLRILKCTRVGFGNSLQINDFFEYENEKWIIRSIGSVRLKSRRVKGFANTSEIQQDVFEAVVVAQKVGVNSLQNLKETRCSFHTTTPISRKSNLSGSVGEFIESEEDGRVYIVTKIMNVGFNFVDLVVETDSYSITELPETEIKKLVNKEMLNKLGWKIIENETI